MPRPKQGGRKRRTYHHGDLRRALLEEAVATIRTSGVEALTLRDIGARVGVSRTALYRHFADKRALLAAVATDGFRSLRERLVGAWDAGGHDLAGFRAMGAAYVGFALDHPSHYRVMFGDFLDFGAGDAELAAEGAGAFQALVDAVGTLQEAGFLRRDDTVLMSRFIWSVVHGLAMFAIDAKLREPGAIEELMEYASGRLGAAIAAGAP